MRTKTLITAAILAISAAPAFACEPLEDILDEYRADYGERPYWMGNSQWGDTRGKTILLITGPLGTWTMFSVDERGACIEDFGTDAEAFRRGDV